MFLWFLLYLSNESVGGGGFVVKLKKLVLVYILYKIWRKSNILFLWMNNYLVNREIYELVIKIFI